MSRATRTLLAVLLSCAAACSDDTTSLFLRVEGADGATQLELRGLRDGAPWFGPERRPETEGEPFSGEQSVRLRFNAPPDVPFVLEVDALANGMPIARASAEVLPRKGDEVELRLVLSPVSVEPLPDGGQPDAGDADAGQSDGGETDGGDPDAGVPDAGMPDAGGGGGCATGCIHPNGTCVTSPSTRACGGSGLACVDCLANERANTCTTGGSCACGTRGRPCEAGERCDGNSCVCDPELCAGCCQDNVCRQGDRMDSCGIGGAVCKICNPNSANNCSAGGCRCGTNEACSGLAPNCDYATGRCTTF
jgi:hypothetical protein